MSLVARFKRCTAALVGGLLMAGPALATEQGAAAEPRSKGQGWGKGKDCKFVNLVTQKIEGKAPHFERMGDTLVGCAIDKG